MASSPIDKDTVVELIMVSTHYEAFYETYYTYFEMNRR